MSSTQQPNEPELFPWHIGVYDAHCHPTDTMSSQDKVVTMRTKALTIMATRRQDQRLVADFTTSSVTSNSSAEFCNIVPSFGWHPWFSHQLVDDHDLNNRPLPPKSSHYRKVLVPPPDDDTFIESLPEVQPLSAVIEETRTHLRRFPQALVGEVGLDRSFRIPSGEFREDCQGIDPALTPGARDGRKLSRHRVDMAHQCKILRAQLMLAAELQRPVSIHGVAAHGILFDTLSSTWRGADGSSDANQGFYPPTYPPRICLHSFSGSVEVMKRYLHPSVPLKIFFSFSVLVNFASASTKAAEAIRDVPTDRLLVESDLHTAGERLDGLIEEITRRVCIIRGWTLIEGVTQLASNWRHFVFDEQ